MIDLRSAQRTGYLLQVSTWEPEPRLRTGNRCLMTDWQQLYEKHETKLDRLYDDVEEGKLERLPVCRQAGTARQARR